MASVRHQAFAAIEAKLEVVRSTLDWLSLIRNSREAAIGEDQMNALLLSTGGEMEPDGLTGHVAIARCEFSVGMLIIEPDGHRAEDLLDQGFVAVCNALLDPGDMQLGGLVNSVLRKGVSAAFVGRSLSGARIIGAQTIDFEFEYMTREGDAEVPGP